MNSRFKLLLGACFFLSGATSLVFEVAWSKQLSYILGDTLYAVATVVAAFMAGLGLGSALAGVVGERIKQPVRAYAFMQFAIAVCGAVSIPAFRATQPLFGLVYQAADTSLGLALAMRFLGVFVLMMLPVTLMGMTLSVVVGAYGRRRQTFTIEAGVLYGVNTLGAVVGTLGAGFLLIPALGLSGTCVAAAALDVLAGFVAWRLNARVGVIEDIRGAETRGTPGPSRSPRGPRHQAKWTGRQRSVGILLAFQARRRLPVRLGGSGCWDSRWARRCTHSRRCWRATCWVWPPGASRRRAGLERRGSPPSAAWRCSRVCSERRSWEDSSTSIACRSGISGSSDGQARGARSGGSDWLMSPWPLSSWGCLA